MMRKRMRTVSVILAVFGVGATLAACRQEGDRPEVVSKVRALGAIMSPSTPEVSALAMATARFIVAVPKGSNPLASEYFDGRATFNPAVALALDQSTAQVEEHSGLSLFMITGTPEVPSEMEPLLQRQPEGVRLRYGVRVGAGGDEDIIVGDVRVYPDGAAPAAAPLTITIESPRAGDVVAGKGETGLVARIDNPAGDRIKIGWYVTGGEVKNRRAASTTLKDPGAGSHTIVVTVRGLRGGGFHYATLDLTAQ